MPAAATNNSSRVRLSNPDALARVRELQRVRRANKNATKKKKEDEVAVVSPPPKKAQTVVVPAATAAATITTTPKKPEDEADKKRPPAAPPTTAPRRPDTPRPAAVRGPTPDPPAPAPVLAPAPAPAPTIPAPAPVPAPAPPAPPAPAPATALDQKKPTPLPATTTAKSEKDNKANVETVRALEKLMEANEKKLRMLFEENRDLRKELKVLQKRSSEIDSTQVLFTRQFEKAVSLLLAHTVDRVSLERLSAVVSAKMASTRRV